MNEENYDPLNPDREQQLFEALSMSDTELEMLNYIRTDMKSVLVLEKWKYEKLHIKNNNSN